MSINIQTAPIEEVKQFAKDILKMRIAHNTSEENIRKNVADRAKELDEKVDDEVVTAPALSAAEKKEDPVDSIERVVEPEQSDLAETGDDEDKEEETVTIKLNRKKPFGTVRGSPGIAFFQAGNYFNSQGELASE